MIIMVSKNLGHRKRISRPTYEVWVGKQVRYSTGDKREAMDYAETYSMRSKKYVRVLKNGGFFYSP